MGFKDVTGPEFTTLLDKLERAKITWYTMSLYRTTPPSRSDIETTDMWDEISASISWVWYETTSD